jgi:hypothetical protein
MKDRLLLLLTGVVCAGLAWLAWSRFPDVTIGLIVLGPVVCSWLEHRRDRLREKLRAADGDRRERQRQLERLAVMLAALRGGRGAP